MVVLSWTEHTLGGSPKLTCSERVHLPRRQMHLFLLFGMNLFVNIDFCAPLSLYFFNKYHLLSGKVEGIMENRDKRVFKVGFIRCKWNEVVKVVGKLFLVLLLPNYSLESPLGSGFQLENTWIMIRIMSGFLKRLIFDLVDEFDVDIEREANIIEVLWIIMLPVHGGVIIDPGET